MHLHTVFFWISEDVDNSGRRAFETGLDLLTREPHVLDRRVGKPAATKRPVIDSSYSYAIILRFENLAAHNAYQASDEHQIFLDTCSHMWSRVQVYDVEEMAA